MHTSGHAGAVAKTGAVLAVSGGLLASIGLQSDASPAQASTADASPSTSSLAALVDNPPETAQSASVIPASLMTGATPAPRYGVLGFKAKPAPKPKPKPTPTPTPASSAGGSASTTSQSQQIDPPPTIQAGSPGSAQFGAAVLEVAARYLGVPYVYGGSTPAGFDCSGYTSYVYRQVGINLPRTSSAQRAATRMIPRSQAMPGDLVFSPGHVGIYAGNGMMYDAPRTGKSVSKRPVYSSSATYGRVSR
ncbi:MAG: C40 family peptidase [Angustibacter sp.]